MADPVHGMVRQMPFISVSRSCRPEFDDSVGVRHSHPVISFILRRTSFYWCFLRTFSHVFLVDLRVTTFLPRWYTFHSHFWYIIAFPVTIMPKLFKLQATPIEHMTLDIELRITS